MAHAVSSLASSMLFSRKQLRCREFFQRHSRNCRTNSTLFSSHAPRQGLRIHGLSSTGGNDGVSEVSESQSLPFSYAWPEKEKRPRVCILGGGFGGLYTALRLESLEWPDGKRPQVVLVDQSERFVFKPLLYELLSGEVDEWEIAPRFSDLLSNTTVQFFKDRVQALQPSDHLGTDALALSQSAGTVHLESGLLIEYDWLVLALGSDAKLDVVPGAMEYALPFSTLEDARRVNEKLTALERLFFGKESPIRVAIVGCGYSGVELAATISERLQGRGSVQAINVDKIILPNAPASNRESALKTGHRMEKMIEKGVYLTRSHGGHTQEHQGYDARTTSPVGTAAVPTVHGCIEETISMIAPAVAALDRHPTAIVVLSSRNVELLLGYFVRCMRRAAELKSSPELANVQGAHDATEHYHRSLILELQPVEKGTESQIVEADLVLWTVGSKPLLPDVQSSDKPIGLPLNGRGQAETDETLQVKGHPRTFAIGDSSAVKDKHGKLLPGTAQVAFQQADFAGWNLWAAINGRPLLPFRFQNLGEMMTLGRFDAAISPSFIEGLTLEGPVGHTARKVAYLMRLPTDEHRLKVGISWLTKAAVESTALLQDTLAKMISMS